MCIQYEHYKGIQLPEGVVEGSVDIGECGIVEEFTGSFPESNILTDAGEQLKYNDKLGSVAPFIFTSW